MSVSHLLALRRSGQRPAMVTVLIGRPCKHFDDGAGYVTVAGAGEDLSALVGLPVHVLDLQEDPALTLRTLESLEAVGVKPLGVCGPAGACGSSPEHERAMQSLRSLLCAK